MTRFRALLTGGVAIVSFSGFLGMLYLCQRVPWVKTALLFLLLFVLWYFLTLLLLKLFVWRDD